MSPILEYSSTALLVITIIGSTTAFICATCGLLQNDLKRIIAFSTISQLGYILLLILLVAAQLLFYILPSLKQATPCPPLKRQMRSYLAKRQLRSY